jgi:hypothetical protein
MLQGDFSQLLNSAGQLVDIYDPNSTKQQPDGSYLRTPLPGNRIPAGQINPIAAKLITFYPQADRPGTGPANINNYSVLKPQTMTYTAVLGKMDFKPSQKSNISFRYGQTPWISSPSLVWANNVA